MEVPVALFVHNRPDLLDRTLDCLRAAGFRQLYVFSDGPRSDDDERLVGCVRDKIRAVGWTAITLIERERNLGLSGSITAGLDWLFERHERAVVIEDDVWIAPEFSVFAAKILDAYADEERVAGLTGVRFPFRRTALKHYPYDAFMLPRFSSWGWATWKRAWQTFEFDREALLRRLRSSPVPPEVGGADLAYMLRKALIDQKLHDCWDVYCAGSMIANGQLFVVPTWNMVENAGFSTGTHPHAPRWRLRWETRLRPNMDALRLPPVEVDRGILRSFHVFRENRRGRTYRRLVRRPARMLVGQVRKTYDIFR